MIPTDALQVRSLANAGRLLSALHNEQKCIEIRFFFLEPEMITSETLQDWSVHKVTSVDFFLRWRGLSCV